MAEEKIRVVIVDDTLETRENIQKLLQFESDIEVVGSARTGREGIQIVSQTSPDVVLMDINMPDMDGITATEKIRQRFPVTQIVILSVQSDPSYMRRAMLAGARDFLTKPPDLNELISAIRRSGELARAEREKAATRMELVQAVSGGATGALFLGGMKGKVITFYSPKGGTGCTTITSNVGVALKSEERPICVVDSRIQFGDLSFFFNEQGRNNVQDLASRAESLDQEIVDEVVIKHEATGVHILAAPSRPELAENVTGEQLGMVINYFKNLYSYVLVDTGSALNEYTLAAFDASDLIVLVGTQDIPSIKNIRLLLDWLKGMGFPKERMVLAMNKFDRRRNVAAERVGELTGTEVIGVVPSEEKLVSPAMDRGVPFVSQNKNAGVSKGIFQLAKGIIAKVEEIEKAEEEII